MTPSAVPWPAVARDPVLQWVRTRAPSGTRAAPARPMARLVSRSALKSASAASANLPAADLGSSRVPAPSAARIRSRAQKRFTAVGRLAARFLNAVSIAMSNSARGQSSWRLASSATPKAAAQPIAGAPRTTIDRMASATSAAFAQLTYSRRAGRARWSISSSRRPSQRRVSTGFASDDALIAAVDRYLGAGGLGEKRPAHLRRQLRDVAAAYLGLEHVVGLVFFYGHRVLLGPLAEQLFGPQAGIEHRVRVHGVDAYSVRAPFERRDARKLVQRGLRSRVGRCPRTRRGNVFRADDHHAPAAGSKFQKRVAGAHQEQVRIEVDVHRLAPLCDGQIGDLAARRENAGVQHEHVQPAEASTAFSRAERTCVSSVTSQLTPRKSPRLWSDSIFASKSSPTTAAPRARKAATAAFPIPEAAPVTSAISPANGRALPPLLSFACSRSQYSTSKMSFADSARNPPRASARRITSMVWS